MDLTNDQEKARQKHIKFYLLNLIAFSFLDLKSAIVIQQKTKQKNIHIYWLSINTIQISEKIIEVLTLDANGFHSTISEYKKEYEKVLLPEKENIH